MHKLIVCLIFINLIFSCDSVRRQPETQCYAQYLAGIAFLQYQNTNSAEKQISDKYKNLKDLEVAAGVTAQEAVAYLESIKNQPDLGLQLYDEMIHIYFEKQDTSKE